MRIVLHTAVLVMTFQAPMFGNWAGIAQQVATAIQRLETRGDDGLRRICSSVVYRIAEKKALALTAAHCFPAGKADVTVGGRSAELILINRLIDLAVVQFRARQETALALAASAALQGDPVAVFGYALGVKGLVGQYGHVAQALNSETETTWLAVTVMPGDSGGPVVSGRGEVVGLTSRLLAAGPSSLGLAIPLHTLREFIEDADDALQERLRRR